MIKLSSIVAYIQIFLTIIALAATSNAKIESAAKSKASIACLPDGVVEIVDGRVVVHEDGTMVKHENDLSALEQWENIVYVTASWDGILCAINKDGVVHFDGTSDYRLKNVLGDVSEKCVYKKIVMGDHMIATLDDQGKVAAISLFTADDSLFYERDKIINQWENVVDVAANDNVVAVLFEDGTIDYVADGSYNFRFADIREWKDIMAIEGARGDCIAGLSIDGKVLVSGHGTCNLISYHSALQWENIVQISKKCSYALLGLKSDGTVVISGGVSEKNKQNLAEWKDIVEIASGEFFCAGITKDGMIMIEKLEPIR